MIARYEVALTLKAPFLTKSNVAPPFGVDAALARTPDGALYLPGTLILGRLAEVLRQFARAQRETGVEATCRRDLVRFFGSAEAEDAEACDAEHGRGGRRRIFVGDFLGPSDQGEVRTRIAIDETGVVKAGAMQVIESPFYTGAPVVFRGEIRLIGPDAHIAAFEPTLRKMLVWISQWGGLRSVGYGEAQGVSVERLGVPAVPATAGRLGDAERLTLTLRFKDAFCVGENRVAANAYESSDVVPGGVLKGAIANMLVARLGMRGGEALRDLASELPDDIAPLAAAFDALRITHAFPTASGRPRPFRCPFSVAYDENGLFDAAWSEDPSQPILRSGRAAAFQPDWKTKEWGAAARATGWPDVVRDFRVRTAVDHDRRAAAEARLFAVDYVRPDGLEWQAEIDLSQVGPARQDVARALEVALSQGLPGVGRGGAFAETTLGAAVARTTSRAGRISLVLQTHAMLRTPVPGETGDVTQAYRAAFSEIVGSDAPLKAIFVRERLSGADFMARRLPDRTKYRPFLLAEAGSVFVFDADDAFVAHISRWTANGLPVPTSALDFYGLRETRDGWRFCPFLPENGYGEVVAYDRPAVGPAAGGANR